MGIQKKIIDMFGGVDKVGHFVGGWAFCATLLAGGIHFVIAAVLTVALGIFKELVFDKWWRGSVFSTPDAVATGAGSIPAVILSNILLFIF